MHFIHGITSCINIFAQFVVYAMEGIGKTLRRESVGHGHLFTICARFADGTSGCRPLQTGKCPCPTLDKSSGMGIMVLERKYEKHVCHPMGYQPAKTVTCGSGGFCQFAPLDKPGGMGIIIDTRGRCDKRSAP